ncbi:MAG: tetratricopeptide repeat protein [Leptospiraceae bacterium]|nr:tetratricopeptide repeat protein [Leptospiraceae bacterium]
MGNVITFYSYKGGVGRTMSLVSCGVLLAQWGYKVLMVDWDMEAPGLEFFFKDYTDIETLRSKKGLIDIFAELSERKVEEIKWNDYISTIRIPDFVDRDNLHLITSGKKQEKYYSEILKLDIDHFYNEKDGGNAIESLRNHWKSNYDFVLIDSRTGVTDISGICTVQLPDIVVLLFTATEQSFSGILQIAQNADMAQQELPVDRMRLRFIPVPSRFDMNQEYQLGLEWLDTFAEKLEPIFKPWLPIDLNPIDFLKFIKLPYIPFYSFGEKIPSLEKGVKDPSGLGFAYEYLAGLILGNLQEADLLFKDKTSYLDKYDLFRQKKKKEALELSAKAKQFSFNREYQESIREYSRAIELDSTNPEHWNDRGNAYFSEKEYDKAIHDYSQAIELNPEDSRYWANCADAYYNRREYENAIQNYSEAIKLSPKVASYWNNRGEIYFTKNEFKKAIEDFTEAITLNPTPARFWYNRGTAYSGIREYSKAIEDFTKAIELNPKDSNSYRKRAMTFEMNGSNEEAIKDSTMSIELNPNNADNYSLRGFIYNKIADYDNAIKDFTKAIELYPTIIGYYDYRAIAYFNKKDFKKAIEDYKAIELLENYSNTFTNFSRVLFVDGQLEQAIQNLEKAFAMNPTKTELVELWFYLYAHVPERREEAEKELLDLLHKGERSKGWNLEENVRVAIEQGHPDPEQLKSFAKIITEDAHLSILQANKES